MRFSASRPTARFTLIGKPARRVESLQKVTGQAVFALDVKVPGALTALVARPPVFGGQVKRFDVTAAKQGREALTIEWDHGVLASLDSATQRTNYLAMAAEKGAPARHDGEAAAAFAGAATKVEGTFDLPYLAHAAMEPVNATAHVRAEGVEVWAPTQFQRGAIRCMPRRPRA